MGLRRIVWPTFILLLQAVFFAHGGLTTLGVNTLALGLIGPVFTLLLWSLFRRFRMQSFVSLGFACGLGGLSVYIMDAFVLGLALSNVVEPMVTFGVLAGFAPVQIPLSILEAFISVKLIRLVARRRPDILPLNLSTLPKTSIPSNLVACFIMTFLMTGCAYEGIDGTVFGEVSTKAGYPP